MPREKPEKLDVFHYHEALDRADMVGEIISNVLADHPVIKAHKNYSELVDVAHKAVWDLYQAIGYGHLKNDK